jgi:murein DD-endopeptidase MepM/ murein hydrolase activator NlpD
MIRRANHLSVDRQHHKSKKNRYTIVLVPDEDASKAKNFKMTPWQLIFGLILFASVAVTLVLLTLTYTPVGLFFPLSNPHLENKYGKELISLNQRMTTLMEQLMELRAYNIKLRRVLGESVTLSDSGEVLKTPKTRETDKKTVLQDEQIYSKLPQLINSEPHLVSTRSAQLNAEIQPGISFPAILPTEGYVTRGYEPEHSHFGLDIAGKTGTPIVAAADGNIVFSGWTHDDGYIVIMSHSSGFMTFYKHNQSLIKSTGSFIRRGEPIATLGNSGITSAGPHLHFEIWKDGVTVDPSIYMINFYL